MSELVSVIIPTYNRANYLARALGSVAEQTYRPIEAFVVDDGSRDGTEDLIPEQRRLLGERGIELTYVKQENGGPARARNRGLEMVKGACVGFLDSDDLWKPSFMATMKGLLDRHPSAGLAFGGYLCIDAEDRLIGERPTGLPAEPREGLLVRPFLRVLNYVPLGTPCALVRRGVLDELGHFDTSLHVGEDWDLWYRIAKRYDFAYTLEGLTMCRDHPHNMPKANAGAIADKIRLILKHLPDIEDAPAREEQVRRMRLEMVLLQEQLLREGKASNGMSELLEHELRPRTMRYWMGAVIRRGPRWMGSAYARMVRAMGTWQRGDSKVKA